MDEVKIPEGYVLVPVALYDLMVILAKNPAHLVEGKISDDELFMAKIRPGVTHHD